MKSKEFLPIFLFSTFLLTHAVTFSENKQNLTVIEETAVNRSSKQIVVGEPIVIHTQLEYYDQPTLKEYQECHENLEQCKKVCLDVESAAECVKQCPVCPYLIKEKVVVQGINDTDYSSDSVKQLNTTNIIRLTNQIRNIIETHQGHVTNRNENTVHVHQNASRVGGKFGLGYNNNESCCIIVRLSRNCEMRPLSTASRCQHHKRRRVCGKHCTSRVMLAKHVTLCEISETSENYSEENCHETVKYVPYQTHRKQSNTLRNKCTFSPTWPYVLCGQNFEFCRHCLDLPFYYILQRGIPPQCGSCFMTYASPSIEIYPQSYPIIGPNFINNDDSIDSDGNGWQQEKTKCRLPNGTITENCQEIEDTDSPAPTMSGAGENFPVAQDEYFDYNDFEKNPRKRRQTFTRSKYSRRYI